MPETNPNSGVYAARSRLAVLHQRGRAADPAEVTEARRDLNEAKLERAVREALAAAPSLTLEQRQRISEILSGGAK